jgi:hypothetical protein
MSSEGPSFISCCVVVGGVSVTGKMNKNSNLDYRESTSEEILSQDSQYNDAGSGSATQSDSLDCELEDLDSESLDNASESTAATSDKWSADDVRIMAEHTCYKLELIAQLKAEIKIISNCRKTGNKISKKELDTIVKCTVPKSNLKSVICISSKSKSNSVKSKKRDIISEFNACSTSSEINEFLLSLVMTNDFTYDLAIHYSFQSATQLAECLNKWNKNIEQAENDGLNYHIDFGRQLKIAHDIFKTNKKQWQIDISWEKYVAQNVGLNNSTIRRHVQMYQFVSRFEKLRHLKIKYNDLWKMHKKIDRVFSVDESIAKQWQLDG